VTRKIIRNIGGISTSALSYQLKKYHLFKLPLIPPNLAIKYRLLSSLNELVDVIGTVKLRTILGCHSCDLK
jgi:hypothetical protein